MEDTERDEIVKMIATPGWGILENWLRKKIKDSKSITCVDTSSDEKLLLTFKLAQSRVSVYSTILEWVNSNTKLQQEKKNG